MDKEIPKKDHPLVTILSMDGGRVRGIIITVMLCFLETKLQRLDGKDVRIANYFDIIAGAITGAFITAMLTVPDEHHLPLYAATQIKNFYLEESPKIFPQLKSRMRAVIRKLKHLIHNPKYDGKYLHQLLKDKLGKTRMHRTLTNVMIIAYDIKDNRPVIFTLFKAKEYAEMDAFLYYVCIGTSAAPTYLPLYKFTISDSKGDTHEFNLIHNEATANNLGPMVIAEVEGCIKRTDSTQYLMPYLGTSRLKMPNFDANEVSRWGAIRWILHRNSTPLIDKLDKATMLRAEFEVESCLESLGNPNKNYLQVQP